MTMLEPRTIHLRDQVRACLVDRDAADPISVKELLEDLEVNLAYYQQVYGYLRSLERKGLAERWERPKERQVLWSATADLRISFAIDLPPMRTRNPGPPNRRIRR
jgi:hypothetical protein